MMTRGGVANVLSLKVISVDRSCMVSY